MHSDIAGAETFSVTLPAELAAEVRAIAEAHNRSADDHLSALVTEVLGTVGDDLREIAPRDPRIVPLLMGAQALLGGVDFNEWVESAGDLIQEALDRISTTRPRGP